MLESNNLDFFIFCNSSPLLGASSIAFGKSGSPAVKRNCRPCGRYSPYSWKRILSFQCLRNTIRMKCIGMPGNALYSRVLWMPLRKCCVPKYSQPCKYSKVIFGHLQVIGPKNQILLQAFCINAHTFWGWRTARRKELLIKWLSSSIL